MSPAPSPLPILISELGFTPVTPHTAIGEAGTLPAAITMLADDPPGLLLQWRCQDAGRDFERVSELLAGTPESQARMSLENGAIWLSLYDVTGQTSDSLRSLLNHVATTIQATDLALPVGCLQCGQVESAQLLAVEGRPTRVCPSCLTAAVEQQKKQTDLLNSASLGATIGLPAAVALAAAGWALFWTLIDLVLDWVGVQVIELHQFAVLLMLVLVGGAGYALGWPLGVALRRSIALRRAPILAAVLLTALVAVLGETGYLALFLLRKFGVFDVGGAARIVGPLIAGYTLFWIVCKVLVLLATGLCCAISASEQRSAAIDI